MTLQFTSEDSINRFCSQYFQLEPTLDYPPAQVIREKEAQIAIYKRLFSDEGPRYAPPVRYRLRTLKELVAKIEFSIVDWDQHEVSEDLMTALSVYLATPIPSETSSVQQKSYVTYHLSALEQASSDRVLLKPDITLLEARSLISASGTTGLRTWEAALHLGQYLCANQHIIAGRRVLELGAGTGYLAVLCAKHLGAARVVASDGSDDVINTLPESFFLNDLQDSDDLVRPMELRWGHALVGTEDQQWNNGDSIDVVFGADITYDRSIIPALVSTLEELFALFPKVEVLISATQRNEVTFEAFCNRCQQRGMALDYVDFPIAARAQQMGPFYSDSVPIRICRVSAPLSPGVTW